MQRHKTAVGEMGRVRSPPQKKPHPDFLEMLLSAVRLVKHMAFLFWSSDING